MDLRTQVEGIVAKIIGAVEELAARVEAGPAGVGPDEFQRDCRDLGLAWRMKCSPCSGPGRDGGLGAGGALPVWRHPAPPRPSAADDPRSHQSALAERRQSDTERRSTASVRCVAMTTEP